MYYCPVHVRYAYNHGLENPRYQKAPGHFVYPDGDVGGCFLIPGLAYRSLKRCHVPVTTESPPPKSRKGLGEGQDPGAKTTVVPAKA